MSSRDRWVENLRCPQCEKTGPAELSQMDGPFDIQVDIFQCRNTSFTSITTSPRSITRAMELPDKHAAWREATVMAGQTLQGLDGKLQPGREWRMEVTDEFANPLYVLHINAEKPK
jgi:hypothetical protein